MSQTLEQFGIDRLSIAERLDLIERIWDSIEGTEGPISIPDWHRSELERRRAASEVDPSAGIAWEDFKPRLADRS